MRVLVYSGGYVGHGAGTMLLALLEHWVGQLRWSVDVVMPSPPQELVRTGVNTVSSPSGTYDFALLNTIAALDCRARIDPATPIMLWMHEARSALLNVSWSALDWCNHLNGADHMVFQSEWQARTVFGSFLDNLPSHRVSIVPNGLPAVPAAAGKSGQRGDKKRIVFLGSLCARKRPQDLIDAVVGLGRNDIECLFIGPTEARETLGDAHNRMIDARPDLFRVLGQKDREASLGLLAGADVFCLPSEDESQPIAILEAAHLGVPMALSDLPPYRGVWVHGANCLLSPVRAGRVLRWNLRMLLDDAELAAGLVTGAKTLARQYPLAAFLARFGAAVDCMLATTTKKRPEPAIRYGWSTSWVVK